MMLVRVIVVRVLMVRVLVVMYRRLVLVVVAMLPVVVLV